MNDYLSNVIIPYYKAQTSTNLRFILLTLDFKILTVSEPIIKGYGLASKEMLDNKPYEALGINEKIMPYIQKIADIVIKTKKALTFLTLGGQQTKSEDNYYTLLTNVLEPILDENQYVVALLARRITNLNSNYFDLFFEQRLNSPDYLEVSQFNFKIFTAREHEILYLLSNGLSQYQIAEILGIKRSTVLRAITDRIMVKLRFNNNNTGTLINTMIRLNIHAKIPKSLVPEQVVILDDL